MILRGKYNGAKMSTEALDLVLLSGRRAFAFSVEGVPVRSAGANASEHAGMSSDNWGENPQRRNPRFLRDARHRRVSRVLSKVRKGVCDGKLVNIPMPTIMCDGRTLRVKQASGW